MIPVSFSIIERMSVSGTLEYSLAVALNNSSHISFARFTEICRIIWFITRNAPLRDWLVPGFNDGHAIPVLIPKESLNPNMTFPWAQAFLTSLIADRYVLKAAVECSPYVADINLLSLSRMRLSYRVSRLPIVINSIVFQAGAYCPKYLLWCLVFRAL